MYKRKSKIEKRREMYKALMIFSHQDCSKLSACCRHPYIAQRPTAVNTKESKRGRKKDKRAERPRQKVMSYFLTGLLISSLSTDWICTRLIAPSSHPYHPLRMNVPVHEGTILVLSDASALTLDLGSLPKCVFGKITTLR